MFRVRGVFRIFFREEGPVFVTFQAYFFSTDLIFHNLSNKNDPRGSGGMLPGKFFENLHTAMAFLALIEKLLRKVCHIFGP